MKVETPQILWNSEGDKGHNAALYSISMLESGLVEDDGRNPNVMVTSGNTNVINLWKVAFKDHQNDGNNNEEQNRTSNANASNSNSNSNSKQARSNNMFQQMCVATKIEYLCSLTRHEQAVNTVAFSPDGLHLASAGDTGSILIWSVPPSKRGNGNGRHYWASVQRDQDLTLRVISRSGQGICDLSWSADSKRLMAGTIDHSVLVMEDKHYDANHAPGNTAVVDSDWKLVFQNSMDHTQYVQGVAYDPLGVYLASMGSDRSVRVYARKAPPKSKKKVLRQVTTNHNNTAATSSSSCLPPPDHHRLVQQVLTDAKLEMGKSKQVKFMPRQKTATATTTSTANNDGDQRDSAPAPLGEANQADACEAAAPSQQPNKPRHHLYADESTLESFFRRLSWTTDGSFLVTPAALWQQPQGDATNPTNNNNNETPSFATYLFARHRFDEPYKVLSGLEKPSVVVRPNPVLFQLPPSSSALPPAECKENQSPTGSTSVVTPVDDTHSTSSRQPLSLPYRSVFAVLTLDSILVYDTHHTRPLSIVRGLHYSNLVDCQWSADGRHLVVCSSDGYISIITFGHGELGQVYEPPAPVSIAQMQVSSATTVSMSNKPLQQEPTITSTLRPKVVLDSPTIPPCEPGQTATLEAPPSKRSKKTRITPTLISGGDGSSNNNNTITAVSSSSSENHKRPAASILDQETAGVGEGVTKLTLANNTMAEQVSKPKKKKRLQPTLVTAGNY